MGNARQDRGKRTNVVVASWLREHGWLRARPTVGAETGQDVKEVYGHSVEVKARANFDPMGWLKQARGNATPGQRPCVIIRCNGQGEHAQDYLVIRRLEDDELAMGPSGVMAELLLARQLIHDHAIGNHPGCPLAASREARHALDDE